jgi:hypothetical protein
MSYEHQKHRIDFIDFCLGLVLMAVTFIILKVYIVPFYDGVVDGLKAFFTLRVP